MIYLYFYFYCLEIYTRVCNLVRLSIFIYLLIFLFESSSLYCPLRLPGVLFTVMCTTGLGCDKTSGKGKRGGGRVNDTMRGKRARRGQKCIALHGAHRGRLYALVTSTSHKFTIIAILIYSFTDREDRKTNTRVPAL